MASSSSSSSSSSSLSRSEYDVFLSFRGADTRKTFVGHLYTALNHSGFRTFKDDERLGGGRSISQELLKNINESRIAVIVFSKNYANSSWCLDELVEILKCRKTKGQIVLPIFYHVKPWEVRHQKRSFEEAFGKHEETYMERVQTWRAALTEAANLKGYDLEDEANGYENKLIEKIVQVVSEQLPRPLHVAEYEVGIDARVDKIIELLKEGQLVVGICGIGGAGKTTVAKAVFNRISNSFEGSCFLHNVREESTKYGEAKLQTILLRKTLMDDTASISYPDEGINVIKGRLGGKRILLVLDDVDKEKTLKYLVGGVGEEWFGSGSRIIITTRDKHLLENYNARIYDIELLNDSEALQLFCWHAFKQNKPKDDYEQLSHCAKYYVKGLPLALKVLGSHLYNRTKPEWSNILDSFKTDPIDQIHEDLSEIHKVLRISYEGLNEVQKHIFLDVACFFNGYEKEHVMNVSKWSEYKVDIGIQTLRERSLINISEYNMLSMHDLIQEMGRKIVLQESEEPGKRSSLWSYEDICEVFNENTVTENIEAIMLPSEVGLHVSGYAFAKMRKLRILKINGVMLDGCLTHLSNELRYLEWDGYPQEYLPYNFHPKNPVQLRLSNSLIKGFGTNAQFLKMLKDLNLSYCKYLGRNLNFSEFIVLEKLTITGCDSLVEVEFDNMKIQDKLKSINLDRCKNLRKTPNVSGLPYLMNLSLWSCSNLVEVHPSIKFHKRLASFSFDTCENLKILPTTLHMKSVTAIDLSGCSKLEKFPVIEGDMECVELLSLDGTAIKELSSSVFKHLKGLRWLSMRGCKMLKRLPNNIGELECLKILLLSGSAINDLLPSVAQLKGLEKLDLEDCKMLGSLPNNIGEMKSLSTLWLRGSGIKDLPPSVTQLKGLETLDLQDCKMLGSLPNNIGEMKSLLKLKLGWSGIKDLPPSVTQLKGLKTLDLQDCKMLGSLPNNIGEMKSLLKLKLGWSGIKDLPPSVTQLKGLKTLDLQDCKMLGSLPNNIGEMKSLSTIWLEGSGVKKLPASFSQLENLNKLVLDGCLGLQTLESLPSSIGEVQAQGCVSLQQYSIPKRECISYGRRWIFSECHKLVEDHGNNKPNVYHSESQLQEIGGCIVLPGSEIPSWFTHIYYESESGEYNNSVCLTMDPNSFRNLKGVCVCAVFGIHQKPSDYVVAYIDLKINGCHENGYDMTDWIYNIRSDHIMLFHRAFDPFKEEYWKGNGDGCYIKASIEGHLEPIKMKKWGIHPIMDAHKHG